MDVILYVSSFWSGSVSLHVMTLYTNVLLQGVSFDTKLSVMVLTNGYVIYLISRVTIVQFSTISGGEGVGQSIDKHITRIKHCVQ